MQRPSFRLQQKHHNIVEKDAAAGEHSVGPRTEVVAAEAVVAAVGAAAAANDAAVAMDAAEGLVGAAVVVESVDRVDGVVVVAAESAAALTVVVAVS